MTNMHEMTIYKTEGLRLGQVQLRYCNDHYNFAFSNERTVEVPLADNFMRRFDPTSIVEVGAVMPYYGRREHKVIDLFDEYEGCLRVDATTYDYTGLNVLSISTVEHIGTSDYNTDDNQVGRQEINPHSAFLCIESIIRQANHYLITFPIGRHRVLDQEVRNSARRRLILVRDPFNNWRVHHDPNDFGFAYGNPFNNANAVCVLTDQEDYFC